ncbi:MAG: hypothetical protein ACERKO_09500 [Acetanaerobacterium sp.]
MGRFDAEIEATKQKLAVSDKDNTRWFTAQWERGYLVTTLDALRNLPKRQYKKLMNLIGGH